MTHPSTDRHQVHLVKAVEEVEVEGNPRDHRRVWERGYTTYCGIKDSETVFECLAFSDLRKVQCQGCLREVVPGVWRGE